MSEPTTIHWLTLPRNGNGGAALVTWRTSTLDTTTFYVQGKQHIAYLLGDKPPRYPVPAIPFRIERGKRRMIGVETYDNADGVAPREVAIWYIGDYLELLHW